MSDPLSPSETIDAVVEQNLEAASSKFDNLQGGVAADFDVKAVGISEEITGLPYPNVSFVDDVSEEPVRTEPRLFINPSVQAVLTEQGIELEEEELSAEESAALIKASVQASFAEADLNDTAPEQALAAALEGFLEVAETRYARFISESQLNSQSELIRVAKEAVLHLGGHINRIKNL